MENQEKLKLLFTKYLENKASKSELQELLLATEEEDNSELQELIKAQILRYDEQDSASIGGEELSKFNKIADRVEDKLKSILVDNPRKAAKAIHLRRIRRVSIAASLFIAFVLGLYLYYPQLTGITKTKSTEFADIAPGGNRATLTLADGSKIDLSDYQSGIIIESEDIKYADGSSISSHVISTEVENQEADMNANSKRTVMNKSVRLPSSTAEGLLALTTPKGGQYQITLSDGTKVWLNAASTLKYPSRFSGNERRVELKGEGYFEVSENKKQPFLVESEGQVVEVLGTHFNIEAYQGERSIKTTLLEGAVKVSKGSIEQIMKPGQQVQFVNNRFQIKDGINLNNAIAWKDGYFKFDGDGIKEIMDQLSRWYDVEIEYRAEIQSSFVATIKRDVKISQVLKILESTDLVHFKIEGRRITVLP